MCGFVRYDYDLIDIKYGGWDGQALVSEFYFGGGGS